MKLDAAKIFTSVAVGGADEALGFWDEKSGRTKSFQNAVDIGRAVMVLGGYGLQAFMPRYGSLGDTLVTASIPLLTKSVVSVLRTTVFKGASRVASFSPRRRIGFSGGPAPINAAQTTKPDFERQESY